jgi:hypothetical protein
MLSVGATLAGKIAITALCWLVALGAIVTAAGLTSEQRNRDQRSGGTLFIRVISLLPQPAVRGVYVLIALVGFAIPILGITGVWAWSSSGWPSDFRASFVKACSETWKDQTTRCGCAADHLEKSVRADRVLTLPAGDPRFEAALGHCGLHPSQP